jgi:opacity protein-like surface antigen
MAPAGAIAADMPEFLRGSYSPSSTRWDGFYVGGQLGVANMDTDFSNEASQWVGYNLRNTLLGEQYDPSSWALMPSNTINGQSYGAFLGYNVQWDELVLGFDMAYNRMSSMASSSSAGSINRQVQIQLPGGTYSTDTVTMDGSASAKLIDYATLRGRAGYAFGQFLPYAVFGAAVGRFNYSTAADLQACGFDFPLSQCGTSTTTVTTVTTIGGNTTTNNTTTVNSNTGTTVNNITNTTTTNGTTTTTTTTSTPATNPLKASQSSSKNNAIVAGFVVGLGMDVALLPNVFLRGEWEFVAFMPVNGIRANLNTARVGIAVKF